MTAAPGDETVAVQFSTEDDLGAEAIRIFSRGWPSHVDAVLPDGALLGARLDGVRIRQPGYAAFARVERIELAVTPQEHDAFHAFLSDQLGKPYDKLAIAAFPAERDWRENDAWFCSELIAAALERCGFFPKPLANPANEITPRDLLLLVSPWGV